MAIDTREKRMNAARVARPWMRSRHAVGATDEQSRIGSGHGYGGNALSASTAVGYPIAAETSAGMPISNAFQRTAQDHIWRDGQSGQVFMLHPGASEDANPNRWYIWSGPGTIPGSPGSDGNWTRLTSYGYVIDASTFAPAVAWDESRRELHVYACRGGGDQYCKLSYDGSAYTFDVTREVTGLSTSDAQIGLAVDTNGLPWIGRLESGGVVARERDSGNWTSRATLYSGTLTSSNARVDAVAWEDDDGDPAIAVGFSNDDDDTFEFHYRKDSGAVTAAWSEDTPPAITGGSDDHFSIAASGNDVLMATKTGSGDIVSRVRTGGSWTSQVTAISSYTRCKAAIHGSTGYICAQDGTGTKADRVDIDMSDGSVGTQTTYIQPSATPTASEVDYAIVPCHPFPAAADLILGAGGLKGGADEYRAWFNVVDATANPVPVLDGPMFMSLAGGLS